jgi:hypothetical protein
MLMLWLFLTLTQSKSPVITKPVCVCLSGAASFLHCLKRQILNPLLFADFSFAKPPLSLWSTSTPFFFLTQTFSVFFLPHAFSFSIPQPSPASPIHLDLPRNPNP